MAFDLSTAKPVVGFDISTAKPQEAFNLEQFQPAGEIAPGQPVETEQPGIQDQIKALSETALTLATGATGGTAGMIGGTLEQLSKEILSGDFGSPEAAERIAANAQQRAQQLTNLPETELGQKRVAQVGEALAPLAALTPLAGETAAVSQAARPAISTGARQTGQGLAATQRPSRRALAREIEGGTVSPEAAQFQLKPPREFQGEPTGIERFFDTRGPRIEKDSLASAAVKQGFDEGVIQPLKQSSTNDKTQMRRMTGIAERISKDKLFGMKNRPGDIAGDVLMNKVRVVRDSNRRAGKAIDKASNNLKGKFVDTTTVAQRFLDDLQEMGISVSDDLKLDFKGSDIEFQGGPKSTVRNVFSRMVGPDVPDAFEIHRLKRLIDSEVTYGKSLKGLAGNSERALKSLRAGLDDALDANFPEYNKANVAYAETISALDALQDVAGKKMDLTGPNADKATGTLMRRLMSNAQSRVRLLDAIDDVENAVKKHGGSDLLRIEGKTGKADNLQMLVLFADELDNVFGPAARTSLQGQFDQALQQGVRATTTKTGALDLGLGLAGQGVEKLRGINKPGAFKAIKKLLTEK